MWRLYINKSQDSVWCTVKLQGMLTTLTPIHKHLFWVSMLSWLENLRCVKPWWRTIPLGRRWGGQNFTKGQLYVVDTGETGDRLPGRCSVLGGHTDSSPLTDDHSGWSFQQSFLFQSGLDDTFLEGGDTEAVSFEIRTTLAFYCPHCKQKLNVY